ncbi:MAG TPA: hypothetical protein ENN07_05445 [candidate division Zixibacteria bacterium]|nr:hypothetical protein [candidate division Zixibacteria bacterium]
MENTKIKILLICFLFVAGLVFGKDRSSPSFYSRPKSKGRARPSQYDCRSSFYRDTDISVRGIAYGSFGRIYSSEVEGDLDYNQWIPSAEAGIEWALHSMDRIGFNIHLRINGGYWLQTYKTENEKWRLFEHGYIFDPSLGVELPLGCRAGFVLGGGVFIMNHKVTAFPDIKKNTTHWDAVDLSEVTYFGPKGYAELRLGSGCLSYIIGFSYQYWRADNSLYKTTGENITLEVGEVDRHYWGGYFGIQYYP